MSIARNSIDLSVIILTYNNEAHIGECLKSLVWSLRNTQLIYEIIIIDNNSEDSTVKIVEKFKSDGRLFLFEQPINFGFARGINIGIKHAKGKRMLLLNPDTKPERFSIRNLYLCMSKTNSEIVGGLTYKENGEVHGSFVRNPNIFTLLFDYSNLRKLLPGDIAHKRHYYLDIGIPKTAVQVDVVSGSFMLINKEVINEIGYFDENFFMYLEDVDFCFRALEKGMKTSFCPESKILHIGGASSKNEDRIVHEAWNKSRGYYAKKHFGFLPNLIVQPIFFADNLITNLWRKLKSR